MACAGGAIAGSVVVCCASNIVPDDAAFSEIAGATLVYFLVSFLLISSARMARPLVRDVFYAIDCSRLKGRKDVSRVLVYGAGLRYRTYRREFVRKTTANDRIIVGLLDDDILLRGQYVGGIKVYGTLMESPEIINRVNADAVVIACEISDSWLKIVRQTLEPTGVKITHFNFEEKEI